MSRKVVLYVVIAALAIGALAITTNPDLETLFLHMEGAGVSVTLKKR